MATHFSFLAWKIPWTEEPGRPQSMGLQRVGHNQVTEHTHIHTHINIYNYYWDYGNTESIKYLSKHGSQVH